MYHVSNALVLLCALLKNKEGIQEQIEEEKIIGKKT